jgi:hypothetical protein
VNVEYHRKAAKALVRAHKAGDAAARTRAETVLGTRAQARFLLSDALHVVAVEHGYRSWPELMRAAVDEERVDETIDSGLEYLPGQPVLVRVVRRRPRITIGDGGRAIELAGRPSGWREVADRIADELIVNVSRSGTVGLPVSGCGPGFDEIVRRIAHASLVLYEEILDLDDRSPKRGARFLAARHLHPRAGR